MLTHDQSAQMKTGLGIISFLFSRKSRIFRLSNLYRMADAIYLAMHIKESVYPASGKQNIYFNISRFAYTKAVTGIQRVLLNIYEQMQKNSKEADCAFELVLVGATVIKRGFYVMKFSTIKNRYVFTNLKIRPKQGDIFISLDYSPAENLVQNNELQTISQNGCRVITQVYDLIPIEHPSFFPPKVDKIFSAWLQSSSEYSEYIVNSYTVKKKLEIFLNKNCDNNNSKIHVIPLAAEKFRTERLLSSKEREIINCLKAAEVGCLMVGTIEPRKGYAEVLELFDKIWSTNKKNIILTIVGRQGWNTEHVLEKIKKHNELGRRLFWFSDGDDTILNECYKNSRLAIVASYDEGFGLPLVEASLYGLKILARNIPIFREIGEGNPAIKYFNNMNELEELLFLGDNKHINSVQKKLNTWQEVTDMLLDILKDKGGQNE